MDARLKMQDEGLREGSTVLPPKPEATPSCRECRHYLDYADVSPDEPQGYCSHPFHFTEASLHKDYGGHWTASFGWCEMHQRRDVDGGKG
jgi:hypothetical protein